MYIVRISRGGTECFAHNVKNSEHKATTSIIGLVVEFVVAIDEARVRFTDDAFFLVPNLTYI